MFSLPDNLCLNRVQVGARPALADDEDLMKAEEALEEAGVWANERVTTMCKITKDSNITIVVSIFGASSLIVHLSWLTHLTTPLTHTLRFSYLQIHTYWEANFWVTS